MSHCPACATAEELARHRDTTTNEWTIRRGALNFAVIVARTHCPNYTSVTEPGQGATDGTTVGAGATNDAPGRLGTIQEGERT